jgi:hypothetical protein
LGALALAGCGLMHLLVLRVREVRDRAWMHLVWVWLDVYRHIRPLFRKQLLWGKRIDGLACWSLFGTRWAFQ